MEKNMFFKRNHVMVFAFIMSIFIAMNAQASNQVVKKIKGFSVAGIKLGMTHDQVVKIFPEAKRLSKRKSKAVQKILSSVPTSNGMKVKNYTYEYISTFKRNSSYKQDGMDDSSRHAAAFKLTGKFYKKDNYRFLFNDNKKLIRFEFSKNVGTFFPNAIYKKLIKKYGKPTLINKKRVSSKKVYFNKEMGLSWGNGASIIIQSDGSNITGRSSNIGVAVKQHHGSFSTKLNSAAMHVFVYDNGLLQFVLEDLSTAKEIIKVQISRYKADMKKSSKNLVF